MVEDAPKQDRFGGTLVEETQPHEPVTATINTGSDNRNLYRTGHSTTEGGGRVPLASAAEMLADLGGAAEEQAALSLSKDSAIGLSPEDIPSGAGTTHPEITIPISAAAKLAAGVGGYMTSPGGIKEMAVAATPAAPIIYVKWAKDMMEGGKQSLDNIVESLKGMIGQHVNRAFAAGQGVALPKQTDQARDEQYQELAENAVNLAAMSLGAVGAVHGAVKSTGALIPKPKTKAPLADGTVLDRLRREPLQQSQTGTVEIPPTTTIEGGATIPTAALAAAEKGVPPKAAVETPPVVQPKEIVQPEKITKQQRKDSQEFDRLVTTIGAHPDYGWYNAEMGDVHIGPNPNQGVAAKIHGTYKNVARMQAMLDLKTGGDPTSIADRAAALPALKERIVSTEKMVSVPIAEIPIGSEFTLHGEKFTVIDLNPDTGMVTLKDGRKIRVDENATVKIDPGSLKAAPEGDFVPDESGVNKPWQMTKDEWHDEHLDDVVVRSKAIGFKSRDGLPPHPDDVHKASVEAALKEGKSVRSEVLEDYPDLAPKEARKSSPTLRPGEKSGDLFQGGDAPFNLMGERGTDAERVAAEKAKSEQAAAAKAQAEREHPTLPGTEISVGPGARSPSDVPPGSQLEQLTQVIRTQSISPKEPLATRIGQAINLAGRWAKTQDSATRLLAGVRAASASLRDGYLNLPPWKDFQATIGRWIGADQRTALEVRRFLAEINRAVPNKGRQGAMTNWIQAGGDEALLRERAAASSPANRRGYELALQLNAAEKVLAQNIASYLEARLREGMDAGLLKQGVDNYVTQIWKRPNSATQKMWADLFGAGTLNPNFKYAKQRIFESYFEGEQNGYAPKNKSVGNLIAAYDLAFNRALSARAMIKELQKGKAQDGMPITMTSGKTTPLPAGAEPPAAYLIKPNSAPKGAVTADGRPYRPIDHWALRDWKWAAKGPDGQNVFVQGDMLVHPDHWQHLNNILKSSRLRQNPVTSALLNVGSFAKQTKLSLSPFHLTQEGVHAMAHRVNPANTVEVDLKNPTQKLLVDHGLMVQDPKAYELFAEGMSGGGLVTKIPGIGHLQSWFNDMLFKDYIPRLKMSMALDALERNQKAYAKDLAAGKVTASQLAALTARQANAAFGEQNYRMMGRSPTLQDFFRLTLLAPDFLESRFRFVGQALKPYGREQRIALALMAATLYVGGRILNQVLDDDPHWGKPFSVIHKGKEYRLRTLLGDVQHLVTDPRSFWYNRMSPFIRTATEYVTGRDDRGIRRSSAEQLADAAAWFQPISLQKRSDMTHAQALLAGAGISSKSDTRQQELYKVMDDWRQKQKDPKIAEAYDRWRKETHADSPYTALRHALQNEDYKQAAVENKKLLAIRNQAQIMQALSPLKPFTGSKVAEVKFIQAMTPEQKKLYDKARAERVELYRRLLKTIQAR